MKWSRLAKSSDFEWLGLIQMTMEQYKSECLWVFEPHCVYVYSMIYELLSLNKLKILH